MELKIKLESTIALPTSTQKTFNEAACTFMGGSNAAEIKIEYKMSNGVLTKSTYTIAGKPIDGVTRMTDVLNEELKKLITGGGKDDKVEIKLVYKI